MVECFYSLQGEGKYSGKSAIFYRFAGCNLRCEGFKYLVKSPKTGEILYGCDSIKAVNFTHFSSQIVPNANFLITKLKKLNLTHKPIIVITGGEPLLHYKDEIFYTFIGEIFDLGYEVHFETNGTILVNFDEFPLYKNAVFCISPKLLNSLEPREKRLNSKALKAIKENAKDSFYKFVIDKSFNAEAEILEILEIAPNEVYCMPLGATKKELEKNAKFAFEFCLKNGFNYSDRLHIRVYDDKEGV